MKCLNWLVCHKEAKRGHSLCQSCIDQAIRMDELLYISKHDGQHVTRDERLRTQNEKQRTTK